MNCQPFTILAIGDNRLNLVELKTLFSGTFPSVTFLSASSGIQGMVLCRAEKPDVVFLDIVTSAMDGYEVCATLKADPYLQHIPVVMLMALSATSSIRLKALESGADAFLAIPVDKSELILQVKILMRLKKSEDHKRSEIELCEKQVKHPPQSLENALPGQKKPEAAAPIPDKVEKRIGLIGLCGDAVNRKSAEEALIESNQQLLDIIDFLPDATFVVDSGKKVIAWNKAIEEMTGVKKQDMIGKGNNEYVIPFYGNRQKQLLDLIDADDEELKARYSNIHRSGRSLIAEIFAPALDNGKGAYISVVGSPLLNNSGECVGFIESIRDITTRQKAEQELRIKDELLHLTGEMAKVGGWEFDVASGQTTWTKEVSRIHDMECDLKADVQPGLGFYAEESREKIYKAIAEVISEAKPYDLELEMTSATNRHKWIRTTGMPVLENNKVVKVRGIFQEITDRKASELILENERLQLRTLIETIPDLIWLKGTNNTYLLCNPVFEQYVGMREAELAGKTDYDFESKGKAASARKKDQEVIASDCTTIFREWVTRRSDGRLRLLEITKTPMYGAGRELIGVLGVGRDITEMHLSQESLREREEIYSAIVNQANDAIVLVDIRNGRFLEFNEAACLALGYSRDEFEKLTIHDIDASSRTGKHNYLNKLNKPGAFVFETKHRSKLGAIIDVRVSSRLISVKGTDYLSTIWSDITEKNRNQALLREKDLIFQSLLDNSPIYIFFKDHNSKPLYLSRNYESLLEKPMEDILGKDMDELYPPLKAKLILAEDKIVLNEGKLIGAEEEFKGRFYDTIKFPILREDAPPLVAGFTIDITERKLAQEALKESEEKLRTLINASPDIICFKDAEGRWIQANDRILDLYQLSAMDYFNKTDLELAAGTAAVFKETFMRCAISDEAAWSDDNGSRTEEYMPDINGTIHVFDIIKRPLYYPDKKRKGLVVYGRDITHRILAEEALRNSETRLHALLQTIPDLIWLKDTNGAYLSCNTMFERFFGAREADILGMTDYDFVSAELADSFCEHDLKAMTAGKPTSNEEWVTFADDGHRALLNTIKMPMYDSRGMLIGVLGVGHDITERKKAEEALRESEELYRNLVLKLPDGVYKSTHAGKFVDVNPALVSMLGYDSKEELMAIDIKRQLYFEQTDRESIMLMEKLQEIGVFRLKKKDGSEVWVEDHGWYNLDENKNILFHEGIMRDITARKRAQDEIILLNAELEQRVRQRTLQLENTNMELEAFSYSVSHDLRAPLRGIDGWSLALLEDYNHLLDDQGRVYLDRVRRESQRMGTLIDDLLKLSRVGRFEMKKMEVDISAIVQAITLRLLESCPGRQVEFNIQPGLLAFGDPQLLEIALINLLENACKFTGKRTLAKIEFGSRLMEGVSTYFVRDNGVGFDMEYAKKLFGAFQRMHKQSDFPGTGIGLATVQRIIFRHGGRIWAESKPGEGSTFFFALD